MLILIAVAVNTAINSGLFGHASNATKQWDEAEKNEGDFGNGPITINGKEYPSINDYIEGVTGENEDAVALTQEKFYPKLQLAVDAVADDNEETEVLLLKDTEENVVVPKNKNIILNLGNHTVTALNQSSPAFTVNGTVTLKDGSIYNEGNFAISTGNTGETTLRGECKIDSKYSMATIYNSGKTLIESNTEILNTGTGYVVLNQNGGNINMTGGVLKKDSSKKVTVYNLSSSEMIVSGGRIQNSAYAALENYGTFTIDGTAYLCNATNGYAVIYNRPNAILNLYGGTVTCSVYYSGGMTYIYNFSGGIKNGNGTTVGPTL